MTGPAGESACEDTRAIMRLLADYGRLLDLRDGPGWAALFTPEGEWSGGTQYGVIAGRERLARFVTGEFANAPPCVHMLGNYAIDLAGAAASAWSRWLLVEQDRGRLNIALAGSYSDRLVKLEEGWRIARREVTLDLPLST